MNKEIEKLEEKKIILMTEMHQLNLEIDQIFRDSINQKVKGFDGNNLYLFIRDDLIEVAQGCKKQIIFDGLSIIGCEFQELGSNCLVWYKQKQIIIIEIVNGNVSGILDYVSRGGASIRPPE